MLNIIQLGLGPIGQQLTRYLVERKGISIVGAVDPDPQKVGNDVGLFASIEELGIRISPNLESCEATDSADLAVISTVSSLQKMESQIKEAADYDLDVVSTCEELSHPWQTQPELAQSIDNYCKQKEIACVGTGVNPGFLMDYLPSVLTSVCRNVEHIEVERIQNAEPRRKPFRDKIGVGLTESEFKEKEHSIRHVGLKESVYMIADSMNWTLDNVEETLVPVKADKAIQNGKINVSEEQIAGVEQVARGYIDGNEVIVLVFKAAVGIQEPHDTVTISGVPDFKSTIPGGINGDIATSAIIVNAIRTICHASPGLKTMLDIQVPAYFSNI